MKMYQEIFDMLERYDSGTLCIPETSHPYAFPIGYEIYEKFLFNLLKVLKRENKAESFAVEREKYALDGILKTIHQTYDGELLYKSPYERAANLFYLIIKNHPFVDGNKRCACALTSMYLTSEGLKSIGVKTETWVLMAVLASISDPSEKDNIIKLIVNIFHRVF